MKAIITRLNQFGEYDAVGMNNRILTKSYSGIPHIKKYGIPEHFKGKGKLLLEIFMGDNIYKDPDMILHYEPK